MAVRVIQTNDGVQSGVEITAVTPIPGWTDQQLIDFKATAHEADGWTVVRQQGGKRVTCTKTYSASEKQKDPNLALNVQRVYRIV